MDPSSPAVRERVNVTVEVKNIGTLDLPADKFVPLDIRFEGMDLKFDQVSRNYKEGIKAGENISYYQKHQRTMGGQSSALEQIS